MIQVKDLTFEFYNKQLFKQMNLLFESNKVHTIYGDNGIGKTTFFQLLTGLQRNYEGQVLIQNNDIYMLNSFQLSDLISICYASQPQSEIFVHEVFSFSQIMDHDRDHIIKNHTILINSHDEHLSKMPNSIIWEIDNQTFNQKLNLN
jgi:ABC-type cobalamin/Fe3+-siderophores transport system ATPase subunit